MGFHTGEHLFWLPVPYALGPSSTPGPATSKATDKKVRGRFQAPVLTQAGSPTGPWDPKVPSAWLLSSFSDPAGRSGDSSRWLAGLPTKALISWGLAIPGFEKLASCLEPPRRGPSRRAQGRRESLRNVALLHPTRSLPLGRLKGFCREPHLGNDQEVGWRIAHWKPLPILGPQPILPHESLFP